MYYSLWQYHQHILQQYFTFKHLLITIQSSHRQLREIQLKFRYIFFLTIRSLQSHMARFNKTSRALFKTVIPTENRSAATAPLPIRWSAIAGIIWMNVMAFVCTRACYYHPSSIAYKSLPLPLPSSLRYVIILHVLISRAYDDIMLAIPYSASYNAMEKTLYCGEEWV